MNKIKKSILLFTVMSLLFVSVSAETKISPNSYSVKNGSIDGNVITASDTVVTLSADISGYASELSQNGGRLTVSVPIEYDGSKIAINLKSDGKYIERTSGTSVSKEFTAEQINAGVSIEITIHATAGEQISIGQTSISCSPNVEATSTPNATATPEYTATPDATYTPTATSTPTVTPNVTATAKPSSTTLYEKTSDPYDDSNRVTNAPPSMAGDVDLENIDVATQAPEETDETEKSSFNSDPAFGLFILFAVLILLLAADIFAIIWRSKMGFWQLTNGGVARRKIDVELLDSTDKIEAFEVENTFEEAENSDIAEAENTAEQMPEDDMADDVQTKSDGKTKNSQDADNTVKSDGTNQFNFDLDE